MLIRSDSFRLYQDPGCLAALRVEGHDGQGRTGVTLAGAGKPGNGGAGQHHLHELGLEQRLRPVEDDACDVVLGELVQVARRSLQVA